MLDGFHADQHIDGGDGLNVGQFFHGFYAETNLCQGHPRLEGNITGFPNLRPENIKSLSVI